jgi:lysophospholipase L1-like esterase
VSLLAGVLLLLLGGAACGGSDETADPDAARAPLRILFLGNSLTAANDLPDVVASIAEEAGRRPLEVQAVAPGGVSLEEHWTSTGAREAVASSRWDAVVMQQGPSSLPGSREHLRRWARRWADAIRARGGRPALLTVWPEDERRSAFTDVIASYAAAANASGAELLPAGDAWLAAWRRDPDLALYGQDRFHPSELGTVLAALVVYAGLTGTKPAALPVSADAETADVLRAAAAEALAGR